MRKPFTLVVLFAVVVALATAATSQTILSTFQKVIITSADGDALAVAGDITGGHLNASSDSPRIRLRENDAATNAGVWDLIANASTFQIRALTDDLGTGSPALSINRSTGAPPS